MKQQDIISSKYDVDDLVELILKKFRSQKALADELGISEDNLYHKIRRQSKPFMRDLVHLGVIEEKAKLNINIGDKIGKAKKIDSIGGVHHYGSPEATNTLASLIEGIINTQATSIKDQSETLKKQADILEKQAESIDRLTLMLAGHDRKNDIYQEYIEKDAKIHQEIVALLQNLAKVKK